MPVPTALIIGLMHRRRVFADEPDNGENSVNDTDGATALSAYLYDGLHLPRISGRTAETFSPHSGSVATYRGGAPVKVRGERGSPFATTCARGRRLENAKPRR